MYADGQSKELALGPDPGLELYAFVDVLGVEGGDGRVVGHLLRHEG